MYSGKLVFAQLVDHLPLHTFRRCVARYRGHRKVKSFSCLDQYLCMTFAQLTYRDQIGLLGRHGVQAVDLIDPLTATDPAEPTFFQADFH